MASVLLVDDDADIRLLLRLELAAEGHLISEAADGQEALDVIAAHRPDLVVLDIMMPVLDGWGVLDGLDQDTAPPIVVITAIATDGDRHVAELLEKGAIDVIAKPFDPGWLVRLVDAVLLVEPDEREEYRHRRLARGAPRLMGWRRLAAATVAAVAIAAVALAWLEDTPEITAAEAVSATETAFRDAGLEATVQPDPERSTYSSETWDPIDVWAVRALVRSEPVEVQLAREGAHPVAIDDRSLDGSRFVLSKSEYEAVARHVDNPARARATRRHITFTIAAALIVALALAHARGGFDQGDLGMTDAHDALVAHLLSHSVRTGDFTLKSGKPTSWFIDAKQTTCRAEGMLLVADAALEVIPDDVTAIGGLTMGADAVAFGIAAIAATRGRELRSFSVRKEKKGHGGGGRIAGALEPGDKVVITEDAVTRGVSMLEAAEVIREEGGAEPVLLLPVVDRGGTVEALAAQQGLPLRALVTAPELGFPYEG